MPKLQHWTKKFGLHSNPFRDTLDTNLFFQTGQHEEALIKLQIGIEDKHALLLLTGVSGTGKTLASQVTLRALDPDRFEAVFVFVHPGMGKGALLRAILTELDIAEGRFVHERLARLQEEAMRLHELGRRMVIVIDEAHFLKADALHILRTLSNLETEQEKLVTVLLVAEHSLRRRLHAPSYAALRGRITFSLNLAPLSVADLEQYVKFRLLKCGADSCLLDPAIYPLVHEATRGIPREINRLLYNAFIDAAATDSLPSVESLRQLLQKNKVNDV